jgi:predicted site-specific integrase-resolvase
MVFHCYGFSNREMKQSDTQRSNPVKLSLSQTAKESGTSKPTLSRWIAKGKVSAERQQDGSYLIDVSELDRIKDLMKRGNGSGNPTMKQLETPNEANALQREIELLRERLGDKDNVIDDLRRRLDEEAEERRMTQAKLTALLTYEREKAPQKPVEGRFARAWSILTGKL